MILWPAGMLLTVGGGPFVLNYSGCLLALQPMIERRHLAWSENHYSRPAVRLYCAKVSGYMFMDRNLADTCSAIFELPCQEPHKLAPLISFVFRSNPTKRWRSKGSEISVVVSVPWCAMDLIDIFPPSISFSCKVGYGFIYDEGPFCCLPNNVIGSTEKNP